jgi:hypothetical protein
MLLVSNGWHFFFLKTGFNRLAPPLMEKQILNINGGGVSFSQA